MFKKLYGIIENMAKKANKKFPKKVEKEEVIVESINVGYAEMTIQDPQELFNDLMKENNLQIDFDVLEGTIPTQYGIIKLDKPTLVIRAVYANKKS